MALTDQLFDDLLAPIPVELSVELRVDFSHLLDHRLERLAIELPAVPFFLVGLELSADIQAKLRSSGRSSVSLPITIGPIMIIWSVHYHVDSNIAGTYHFKLTLLKLGLVHLFAWACTPVRVAARRTTVVKNCMIEVVEEGCKNESVKTDVM